MALLVGAFSIHSCKLDVKPENSVTYTNAFDTEKELNTITSSILLYTDVAFSEDFLFQTVGGVVDDAVPGKTDIRNWSPVQIVRQQMSWVKYYDIIYLSNLLLENIDKTRDLSEDRLNYHRGQALFAKGLCYLNIAMKYGDAVITDKVGDIKAYPISPQLDVIDAAIRAGEEAYEILPTFSDLRLYNNGVPTHKQYASKGAAAALLAHAYAWKGSVIELYGLSGDAQECYRKSVSYCSDLIEGRAGNYSLLPNISELCKYMTDINSISPEDIWVVAFDVQREKWNPSPSPARSYASYPVDKNAKLGDLIYDTTIRIYESTVRDMYPDAGDQRLSEFFYNLDETHDPEGDGREFALMYKYRESLYNKNEYSDTGWDTRSLKAHYNYWRLAGIYLLRAECLAKLGEESRAIADLNVIRERAGAKPYPTARDTKGVQYAVFKERERELLYESDHRYFDVIRNGYYKTELQGVFETLTKSDIDGGALFLPVPESAFGDNNRNTLIRQKLYWSRFM